MLGHLYKNNKQKEHKQKCVECRPHAAQQHQTPQHQTPSTARRTSCFGNAVLFVQHFKDIGLCGSFIPKFHAKHPFCDAVRALQSTNVPQRYEVLWKGTMFMACGAPTVCRWVGVVAKHEKPLVIIFFKRQRQGFRDQYFDIGVLFTVAGIVERFQQLPGTI